MFLGDAHTILTCLDPLFEVPHYKYEVPVHVEGVPGRDKEVSGVGKEAGPGYMGVGPLHDGN